MNVDFSKNPSNPAQPVAAQPTGSAPVIDVQSTAVTDTSAQPAAAAQPSAPAPSAAVATVPPAGPVALAPSGLVLGDKLPDFKDIILPRLNIGQNIGDLGSMYGAGSVIFGQDLVLFTPQKNDPKSGNVVEAASPPVGLVVLGFRPTRFVEKTKGGIRGRIFDTEQQVVAAGGTLDYNEAKLKEAAGMILFQPLADAVCLVQRPAAVANDGTVFVYEASGNQYALALWSMKGTSYTAAAKRVFFTARALGSLRAGGYPSRTVALTTREDSFSGTTNKAWVPVCLIGAPTSPEVLQLAREILGQ